ncbi:hypothetical protein GCM10009765_44420 [Fodinicola feengrottensis]|uniref:Uncharacterized protein n=1 Tax=Fodinicola feengrottensis TaxID=435914 RepID=A0ABN2HM65_9ACTN
MAGNESSEFARQVDSAYDLGRRHGQEAEAERIGKAVAVMAQQYSNADDGFGWQAGAWQALDDVLRLIVQPAISDRRLGDPAPVRPTVSIPRPTQ